MRCFRNGKIRKAGKSGVVLFLASLLFGNVASATDIYVGASRPTTGVVSGSYWYSDLNGNTRWSYNGTSWSQDVGTNPIGNLITNGNAVILQSNDSGRGTAFPNFAGGTLTDVLRVFRTVNVATSATFFCGFF